MTSFQSGAAHFDPDGDIYLFEGMTSLGSLHFAIARALVERIAGRAANPLAPEDLFDEVEPILFRIAERAYRLRGRADETLIALGTEDLD